ncbi:hypothetical protein vseg_014870 [Gypsophila vaccaria]
MFGEKRRKVALSSISSGNSGSPTTASLTTCRKPILHTGKENVSLFSVTDKGIGVVKGTFEIDVGSCRVEQTQKKNRHLSQVDSSRGYENTRLDSQWTETCSNSGLDDLDSEILESSGLAELDAEILDTNFVSELDADIIENSGVTEQNSGIIGRSVCGSKSSCEVDYDKGSGGSFGVGLRESRSIESRLLSSSLARNGDEQEENDSGIADEDDDADDDEDFESTQFGVLMELCEGEIEFDHNEPVPMLACPLCGIDISEMNEESRQFHANECIDKSIAPKETSPVEMAKQPQQSSHDPSVECSSKPVAETRVIKWLHSLGLAKYEAAFIQQEIDWESLQWLTEKDLITMGISALGPRKKIMQSIQELNERESNSTKQRNGDSQHTPDAAKNTSTNKLITDFFSGPVSHRKKNLTSSGQQQTEKPKTESRTKQVTARKNVNGKKKDIPPWCTVPGTPFRVDAFRYLRRDCSHWFLTHFHIDHYQGLSKSFSYGKIYCSMITARLINTKIGISWDKLEVMPLNQKVNIAGVDVTCYDANHCPGAIMLLFEPPNGQPVLHTGDFRFNEGMTTIPDLQRCHIHTLILDTTYCNPQYDFPKQEEVMQFVIEAIQAESFNPKTLFLIGSYTIGKERLFLEVARVLKRKIYIPVAKLRLLECLGLPAEDMQWLTLNDNESNIHVVPMWTIASFKRLKQLSYQYAGKASLIIAFSPTGWTVGKGKQSARRKRQQGTIIRYEVPYSEHCSFEELKEFTKFISPVTIIPSVNNEGEVASNAMTELLLS